ncbi:MAG: tRNA 2-thiouridine(34) synthase MnmA [Candidatus Omnitrophota bacterium]
MRIIVALSGGADSTVAAYELKKKGHEVIGLTMMTCSDAARAREAAKNLGISCHVIDLSKEFDSKVKKYFVEEYNQGRTPNPCIYCNREIKFGIFFEKVKELGAEKLATGHYALVSNEGDKYFLKEARDKKYDQSYFLCGIPGEKLKFIEFPIGELTKKEVRDIAVKQNFTSAGYSPSQDICFASDEDGYRGYLEKLGRTVFLPGAILDISGKVIGKHKGIAAYTIGQRQGLGIFSKEPLYVSRIDPVANTITIGIREHCLHKKIQVTWFNWLAVNELDKPMEFEVRIRYNSEKKHALVSPLSKEKAVVEFREPQFAPAPGQAAVFYDGEVVVAGAWIETSE